MDELRGKTEKQAKKPRLSNATNGRSSPNPVVRRKSIQAPTAEGSHKKRVRSEDVDEDVEMENGEEGEKDDEGSEPDDLAIADFTKVIWDVWLAVCDSRKVLMVRSRNASTSNLQRLTLRG